MEELISIILKYDSNISPAWTLSDVVTHRVRYVKQTSCPSRVAIFTLTFEPFVDEEPVIIINNASLQEDLVGNITYENDFDGYIKVIVKSIEDELNNLYEQGKAVINLRIIISDLYIHAIDSSELAFRIATRFALRDVLKDSNLLVVR